MKKVRFFSVAVAVVMALFVSVWAACPVTHPTGTLNGIIPTGKKTALTSMSCRTLTCSQQYLKSVTDIKGLLDVNQYCKPATGGRVVLLLPNGTEIGSVSGLPVGTSFSGKTITLPANTYPCNATYCIAGEVTLLNAAPSNLICGISYTSGSATFNCN